MVEREARLTDLRLAFFLGVPCYYFISIVTLGCSLLLHVSARSASFSLNALCSACLDID